MSTEAVKLIDVFDYYPLLKVEIEEMAREPEHFGDLLQELAVQINLNQYLKGQQLGEIFEVLGKRISILSSYSGGNPSIYFHKSPSLTEVGQNKLMALQQMVEKIKQRLEEHKF